MIRSTRRAGITGSPGTFLVDAGGVVRQKIMEEHYMHRMPVATLLVRMGRTPPPVAPQGIRRLDYLEVHTSATEAMLYPGNVFTLFVDIHPKPGVHVYAPGTRDYQGMQVVVEENPYLKVRDVQYAPAETLTLPVLGEALPVYSHPVRVSIDAALVSRQELQPLFDAGGDARDPRLAYAPGLRRPCLLAAAGDSPCLDLPAAPARPGPPDRTAPPSAEGLAGQGSDLRRQGIT